MNHTDFNEAESFQIPGADDTFTKNTSPQLRMGFPDMSYLNPDRQGAPVQVEQTFYKQFQA